MLQFRAKIWNYFEKCVQISTNMPSIYIANPEVDFETRGFQEGDKL